ncbi:MAG: alpha/beta hydrolase, partial [Gemmatimonadetes bacterium]|nr:alpha/beta hydrolase [Gemmatimonadota bacterium]NIT89705.1 alpha/beta hydrolase [Gemmatimonadota bacterium]NIU33489.1 alpha/beta hydrolase [Gemmatimonadota bacterium]NIV63820.1 alpha/beta hydrolase [Gemmatimonadota bacterium]NIW66561.1 alpha/beta hydrolase [Gemmatimonadota bacterium]
MPGTRVSFRASESSGDVSGVLTRPEGAFCLYVFAHGAGAGMDHAFMEEVAARLADRGVATFRYNFPYMEAGRGGPNPAPVLVATVRSAVRRATEAASDLPLLAGGKSMGGRMTSTAASQEPLAGVRGIAFFGFPLHAPGRDSSERGAHLADVGLPMLFLQGTRDKLANLDLLRPLLDAVDPTPMLHVVEGADHGFHV